MTPQKYEPIEIDLSILGIVFRAVTNAGIAVSQFTDQQNYGPAIQQLIIDLGGISELLDRGADCPSVESATKACSELSDKIDELESPVVESMHGTLFLWEKEIASPELRREFYKSRYSWDDELNPPEVHDR